MKPNSKFFFSNVLCVSAIQLQNLLFSLKPVVSLVPGRTTNCLPLTFPHTLQASECMFVLRGLSDSGGPKSPRYWKQNVSIQRITSLETRQILFFVMQCILVHVEPARMKKLSFLCQYSTNWGINCLNWLQLPLTLIGHPHEKWRIFLLNELCTYLSMHICIHVWQSQEDQAYNHRKCIT